MKQCGRTKRHSLWKGFCMFHNALWKVSHDCIYRLFCQKFTGSTNTIHIWVCPFLGGGVFQLWRAGCSHISDLLVREPVWVELSPAEDAGIEMKWRKAALSSPVNIPCCLTMPVVRKFYRQSARDRRSNRKPEKHLQNGSFSLQYR